MTQFTLMQPEDLVTDLNAAITTYLSYIATTLMLYWFVY